jgi:hypothetical protein
VEDFGATPSLLHTLLGVWVAVIVKLIFTGIYFHNMKYIKSQLPTVKEEIRRFISHYNVRISVHPNELIASLTEPPIQKRLFVRFWQLVLIVFLVCKF